MGYRNLLLVEGHDDQYVLHNLLKVHGISSAIPDRRDPEVYITEHTITIRQEGGFEKLRSNLDTVLQDSELERLGIVVDADEGLEGRWNSLQDAFNIARTSGMPPDPDPVGTVFTATQSYRTLQVGIWIMPDNENPGMLEDFIKLIRPAEDTLWARAAHCISLIPVHERRFRVADERKALMHTWLAWQEEPGKPLGQAIKARYLDAHAQYAQQVVNWLRLLFDVRAA